MGPTPNNQGVPATTPKSAVEPDLLDSTLPQPWSQEVKAAPREKQQPTTPYERPEQPMGRTPRGPLESVMNFGAGAMQMFGGLLKTGVQIGQDPETWANELSRIIHTKQAQKELYDGAKEMGSQGVKQLVDPFLGDDGKFSLYHAIVEDPAGALNTIYMAKDAVGGLVKNSGKGMGGVSRLALSKAEAAALPKMTPPDFAVRAGEAIQNFKPFTEAARLAATKTPLKVPLDYLGISPTKPGRDVTAIIANIRAEEAQREYAIAEELAKHRLTPEEFEQYKNLRDLGRPEDAKAASQKVQAAFQAYNDKLRIPAEADYEGLLTDEQKFHARAQQASQRLYGDMSAEHVNEAKARMQLPEGDPNRLNPTYAHMATKKGEWMQGADKLLKSMFGELQDTANVHGTVGPLEARVGGGDYINNPMEAALVQNRVNAQFRIRQRMMREVPEYLAQRGMARAIPNNGGLNPGEEIAPIPFWQKYDNTSARAASVAISRKLAGMGNEASTAEALRHILMDPAMKGEIDAAKHIVLPRWAARRLSYEMSFPGILGRTYDKIERLWKAQATVFRAAYWNNVAAGNGVLASLHGVRLDDAMRSIRLRDSLPPEMKGSKQFVTPYQNPVFRVYKTVASKLGQLDQGMHHTQVHNPIYFTELESGRRATLASSKAVTDAGKPYFISQEIMNNPDAYARTVAMSPQKWQEAIGNKAKLQEQFARSSYRMMELQKAHELASTQYEKAASRFGEAQKGRTAGSVGEFNAGPPAVEPPAEVYPDQGRTQKVKGKRGPFEAGPPAEPKPFDPYEAVGTPSEPISKNAHELIKQMSEHQQNALSIESELNGLKAEALEKAGKAGIVRESIPELERLRELSEKAIEPLNNFGGLYGRLHPFERNVLRRFVPFWAWQKAMTKLVFGLPTLYPTKTFLWNRWGRMMWDAAQDDAHPEWLRGSVPVFHLSDGDDLYMRPFWNPLERNSISTVGDVPVPNLLDVWQNNNWLKVGMDLKGGYNQYTMKPFDAPIDGVRLDTGEMYKLDPSGRAKKTIFQPQMLRSLYGMFPWAQYIDHMLLPANQTSRGWIGAPDPQRTPDGEVAHPTTLLQRMRDIFTPFRQANIDEADKYELMRQAKVIQSYEAAIKKERDPERREKMITILEDYAEMFSRKHSK